MIQVTGAYDPAASLRALACPNFQQTAYGVTTNWK